MAAQDAASARTAYDWPAILKDLAGTAIVSMLLMVPIVSYKSVITQYSLVLEARWGTVFTILGFLRRCGASSSASPSYDYAATTSPS